MLRRGSLPTPTTSLMHAAAAIGLAASLVACASGTASLSPAASGAAPAGSVPTGSVPAAPGESGGVPSSVAPGQGSPGTGGAASPGASGGGGGGTVPAAQAPPEVRTITPLMEGWAFVQDDEISDEEALAATGDDWDTVSLPHTWNAQDAASLQATDYVRGVGWYRLEFPSPTEGARHWLEIGAASLVADVWLNGEPLGEHEGAFTAFRFDITDRLAEDGPNVLLVKADNTEPENDDARTAIAPIRGDFNVSGGLYRYVSLISTQDPAHFDLAHLGGPGVYASTSTVADTGATIDVRARVASEADAAGEYTVRLSLLDAAGEAAGTAEATVSLQPGGEAQEVTAQLTVAEPHLWQGLEDPYLYWLVADLVGPDGGDPIDRVTEHFGIREIRFDPQQGFFLNGQHLRLNGVGMHPDKLGKAWAISEEDMDQSLAMIREMGANAVRMAHFPYSKYAYDKASEMGLIVWAETALGIYTTVEKCTTTDADEDYVENAQQQLRELIRQQYNHASIVTWAVGNESSQGQLNCDEPYDNVTPVLKAMNEVAKEEDPTRPSSYAEYPHPVERTGPYATEGITDLFATNRYFLWYTPEFQDFSPLLDASHARTPDQPLGVSEYGGGAAITHHTDNVLGGYPEVRSAPDGETSFQPEEYAAWLHEQNWEVIESKPYLWGTFLWNMFDFGSAHRNEGDVLGVNTKGLVGFDHETRKDPFYFYKANWSTEPTTWIVGRRYTERAYPLTDVKVYSNADTVELSVNGTSVGTMTAGQCPQRACVFADVTLSQGANTVTATGDHAGAPMIDEVEWNLDTSTGLNIAAGRLASGYVASDGARFGSDDFFSGGRAGPGARDATTAGQAGIKGGGAPVVLGTDDPLLYKYFRQGEFTYDIPVTDGAYEVTLGFFEPDPEATDGDRVFDVTANGEIVLEGFDIATKVPQGEGEAEGGDSAVAVTETFPVDVSGGRLTLVFTPSEGEAVVSTISVRPTGAGAPASQSPSPGASGASAQPTPSSAP